MARVPLTLCRLTLLMVVGIAGCQRQSEKRRSGEDNKVIKASAGVEIEKDPVTPTADVKNDPNSPTGADPATNKADVQKETERQEAECRHKHQAAKDAWIARKIVDFEVDSSASGFGPSGSWHIKEIAGKVVSAQEIGGEKASLTPPKGPVIEGAFDEIIEHCKSDGVGMVVTYDPEFGFPAEVKYSNLSESWTDSLTNFRPLSSPAP